MEKVEKKDQDEDLDVDHLLSDIQAEELTTSKVTNVQKVSWITDYIQLLQNWNLTAFTLLSPQLFSCNYVVIIAA